MATCIDPHDMPGLYLVEKDQRARLFLQDAFRLWDAGEAVAAGMYARAAVELHLGALCVADPRVKLQRRPESLTECVKYLRAAGVIDRKTAKKFRFVNNAACATAHGSFVSYARLGDLLRMAAVVVNWWPGECEDLAEESLAVA